MKKIIITLAVVLAAGISAGAQMKGEAYLSGAIGFTSSSGSTKTTLEGLKTEQTTSQFGFSLSPEFGYFFQDNAAASLGFGYEMNREPREYNSNGGRLYSTTGIITLTPGISYYLHIMNGFFYVPSASVSLGMGSKASELSPNQTNKDFSLVRFGLNFNVLSFEFRGWERFGLVLNAGSLAFDSGSQRHSSDNKVSYNNFGMKLGVGTTVGFRYYIGVPVRPKNQVRL